MASRGNKGNAATPWLVASELAGIVIPGAIYNGKGMSGEREARRTYYGGSRQRGASGGGAVLGEVDGGRRR